MRYVHELVLKAFRGDRPGKWRVCRHLNGISTDNRLKNLRWGTRAENAQDAIRHGTYPLGEQKNQAKLSEADVVKILRQYGSRAKTQLELAAEFGVANSVISKIVNRKAWTHVPDVISETQREALPQKSGEGHYAAKLTEQDVRKIRAEYARGRVTQEELGKMFGVRRTTVASIVNRTNWKHVQDEPAAPATEKGAA